MKSKENTQRLTLTIIAAVVHCSTQGKSKGFFLERILKKTTKDLKNYFKELGLHEEACKRRDRDTGVEVNDINIFFPMSAAAKAAQKKAAREKQLIEGAMADDAEEEDEEQQ